MSDHDGMTLLFTGSSFIAHPLSVFRDEGFLKAIDLMKNTDVTFANPECCIIDGDEWPNYGSGMGWAGSYFAAPPMMVDELKFMGISALYAANNHVSDFGERGILSMMKHLRRGGLPFAGIGASLSEASEPCYIWTEHGRVALMAMADWGPRQNLDLGAPWPAGYMPSDEGPWYTSRPGVNLLRYDAAIHVDRESFDQLRRMSQQLDWERAKTARRTGGSSSTMPVPWPTAIGWEKDTATEFYFMGRQFVVGEEFGFSTFPYQEDLDRLYQQIRSARRQAEVVVVALHDQIHDPGKDLKTHDYIRTTAYGAIDAGADVFICNGGTARGVEIYKGKVILHGQGGGFGLSNMQVEHVPESLLRRKGLGPESTTADFYGKRESDHVRSQEAGGLPPILTRDTEHVIQAVVFDQSFEAQEVRAYPIARPGGTRERVAGLVEPGSEVFNRAIQRATDLCKPFGTTFDVRDSYGALAVR